MPLIQCPECERDVSSRAASCPHCGNPLVASTIVTPQAHGSGEGIFMKSLNCGCMAVLGFFALIFLFWIIGAGS